jgi:DNA-binding transcriptional LysR family regulator
MAVFAQVVQQRSFSAAARQVGIAKSAVSKRVAALEERLGVRLLNRTTRKLALTEDGLRYYEHCAALLAAAAAAEDAVAGSSQVARGPIRINAPVTFSQMYLAPALAAFLDKHPLVELNLAAEDRIVDVVEGGYDLVIRISRLLDSSLVARKLATDRIVVVASPAYLARRGTPEEPHELVNHNCLRYTLIPGDREWRFGRKGGRFGVPASGNLAASDGTILREAACAGLGLAVLPYFMAAPDVASGRLVLVLQDHLESRIDIHAVYASRRQLPLRTRLLLDHLVDWFGGDCWDALVAAAARTP